MHIVKYMVFNNTVVSLCLLLWLHCVRGAYVGLIVLQSYGVILCGQRYSDCIVIGGYGGFCVGRISGGYIVLGSCGDYIMLGRVVTMIILWWRVTVVILCDCYIV